MYRDDQAWTEVAKERIEGADFEGRLKAMVALIGCDAAADLFFPRSQILYADVQIDPDSATRQELVRALDEHVPQQIGEMDLDWEVKGRGTVRIAAIPLETLKEALDLASAGGIQVGKFSSLADPADFPRSPNFCGRGANVPLSSLIESASPGKARKMPFAGLGDRWMNLLGASGHRIPRIRRTGAAVAVALVGVLGISGLLWTVLTPESRTHERALEEWSEVGPASGTSLAEPAFAARARESMGTADDLLRLQPPVVHADSRHLSDLWRRSGHQAPGDDAGIAVASLSPSLVFAQPHVPPDPQSGHDAPEGLGTANDLLRQRPSVVQVDAQRLSDVWRRTGLQAPGDDAGTTVAALPTTLALAQPHVPSLPQAGNGAPEGLDTASDLLRQRPSVVQVDAQQLSDMWRRTGLQAPGDDAGTTVAALPTTLALAQPHVPPPPQAGNGAPEGLDMASDILRQRPPVVQVDAQQLSDMWRRTGLQAPGDDAGTTVAALPTTLALAQPHVTSPPQAGNGAPEGLDTASDLLRQRPSVVQVDAPRLSGMWRRTGLQVPADDDVGIVVASLPASLALVQPHAPPRPQAGQDAPESLDTAIDLLRQRPPVAHVELPRLSDLWSRGGLQAPEGDVGITVASLSTSLALSQPHVPPNPQADHDTPLVLDVPLPVEPDPSAPVTAIRAIPHEGSPPGTRSAIDLPAYASLELREFPEVPVDSGPVRATSAAPPLAPPEFLPRMRPEGFAEHVERLKFGGRTLAELATLRPRLRPASAQQLAAGSVEPSAVAIDSSSPAPGMRPDDFDAIIAAVDTQRRSAAAARALRALHAAREAEAALAADAEPELQRNDPRSRATSSHSTVARRATIPNAIRLNEVNLVGVFGTTGDRRALVRLPSGRYVRVRVGDRVDGGRVARITESELFYRKGAQTVSLRVPRG